VVTDDADEGFVISTVVRDLTPLLKHTLLVIVTGVKVVEDCWTQVPLGMQLESRLV
jgi:hypothetical protein